MTCTSGDYLLVLDGIEVDPAGGVPVALLIDGRIFATQSLAGGAIEVPAAAIPALKSGRKFSLSMELATGQMEVAFGLKGSSRALDALAGSCKVETAGAPAQSAVTASAPPKTREVSGNGATMTVADSYAAGSEASIPFTAPEGQNRYWIGFVRPGGGPDDFLTNGYAYASYGNPASVTVPGKPGTYELRFVDETSRTVLASGEVTVTQPVPATLEAQAGAIGGEMIDIGFDGPDGRYNIVAIVPQGTPDNSLSTYNGATVLDNRRVKVQVPASSGQYEIRLVLAVGEYVPAARLPLAVSEPGEVDLPDFEVEAGVQLAVLPGQGARRNGGDYLYLARPGEPDDSYSGGYFGAWGSGPVQIKVPAEPGDWEIRYAAPDFLTYRVLGRSKLTVK